MHLSDAKENELRQNVKMVMMTIKRLMIQTLKPRDVKSKKKSPCTTEEMFTLLMIKHYYKNLPVKIMAINNSVSYTQKTE